jgi:hypothetical protein
MISNFDLTDLEFYTIFIPPFKKIRNFIYFLKKFRMDSL